MKGKRAPEPLIEAVRGCAARKMSAGEAACELSTPARPMTRNAVIGIAHRNDISFSSNRKRGPTQQQRKPKTLPYKPQPTPIRRPDFVTTTVRASVKPARPNCSWTGCASQALEGDMFCYGHGKRGLMTNRP